MSNLNGYSDNSYDNEEMSNLNGYSDNSYDNDEMSNLSGNSDNSYDNDEMSNLSGNSDNSYDDSGNCGNQFYNDDLLGSEDDYYKDTGASSGSGCSDNLYNNQYNDSSDYNGTKSKIESTRCNKKGMTWIKTKHDRETAVDFIGCKGPILNDNNKYECDPWKGDTNCSQFRRLLCHNPGLKLNRPSYPIEFGENYEFTQGWTGSLIRETKPVRGCSFRNIAEVDMFCKKTFGDGFKVLDFYDGWYIEGMNDTTYVGSTWDWSITKRGQWNVRGYGNVYYNRRYWVNVSTTDANCWDN